MRIFYPIKLIVLVYIKVIYALSPSQAEIRKV